MTYFNLAKWEKELLLCGASESDQDRASGTILALAMG
jgi:hypothetical protein